MSRQTTRLWHTYGPRISIEQGRCVDVLHIGQWSKLLSPRRKDLPIKQRNRIEHFESTWTGRGLRNRPWWDKFRWYLLDHCSRWLLARASYLQQSGWTRSRCSLWYVTRLIWSSERKIKQTFYWININWMSYILIKRVLKHFKLIFN